MEIMTVCTGNICRSPLAELLLRARLSDLDIAVHSAGVRALPGWEMTPEAIALAVEHGGDEAAARAHRARRVDAALLRSPDLILVMTREQRGVVARTAPARLKATFTVREFGRLVMSLTDDELSSAVSSATAASSGERIRAIATALAARRGLLAPPETPADDDVLDPYLGDAAVYRRSAARLLPALEQVERIVRLCAPSRSGN